MNYCKWLESLLIALVSLRIFTIVNVGSSRDAEVYFNFIVKISDGVPHLEYFTLLDHYQFRYWKRVGKEWVICDEAESPSSYL